MSKTNIAWNTGIGVTHPDATVVLALGEHLNAMLFRQLRETHGDGYAPSASYDPDECSGILVIDIPSTQAPHTIERKVLDGIAELNANVGVVNLADSAIAWFSSVGKAQKSNEAIVERLVQRAVEGASLCDFDLDTVTRDGVLAAARRRLSSYRGAYVRLSLMGR